MSAMAAVRAYLPVAAKRQVYGQAEEVVDKVLKGREQVLHLLLGHPESQQHPHRHGERQTLALPAESAAQLESKMSFYLHSSTTPLSVPVDVDGLGVGAPNAKALLDDLLDFWEVRLQGLVTKHFGKHL